MGLLDWLGLKGKGYGVDELARRLDMPLEELQRFEPGYRKFTIPKRSGGRREILAPENDLKRLQRHILRRVLGKLRVHDAAHGFERGRSIVTNARPHVGQAVVVRLDLVDFFSTTTAARVERYLRFIGWNRPAAALLIKLCTHEGGLPQGAPTSPRLSNLVNYLLDARIAGMCKKRGAVYTRYADDITLSFPTEDSAQIHVLRAFVELVVQSAGYQVHRRKKAHVRRRHEQQLVTGVVVNEKINLPRAVRRWLRAVEHRSAYDWRSRPLGEGSFRPPEEPTLTPDQLAGWRALRKMIES